MKRPRIARPFRFGEAKDLTAGAATLPATTIEILIALTATALPSGILTTTLPAALTTLATLTALLTTLLLTVALARIIRVRASHNASQCKGYTQTDSGELLFECRLATTPFESIHGMEKGLTRRSH